MISSIKQAVSQDRQVRTSARFLALAFQKMAHTESDPIRAKALNLAGDGTMHSAEKMKATIIRKVKFLMGISE